MEAHDFVTVELVASLGDAFSDIIIKSSERSYRVHRAIVCPRSAFLFAACNGQFFESSDGVIDLSEDDPEVVDLMIRFFYHNDYLTPQEQSATASDNGAAPMAAGHAPSSTHSSRNSPDVVQTPNLIFHAKAAAIADQYIIPGLSVLAKAKFRAEADTFWYTNEFLDAIEYVFSSTRKHSILRYILVDCVAHHPQSLMQNERYKFMVRSNESLGVHIVLHLLSKRIITLGWGFPVIPLN